ncbi:hypothetical protein [Candidatus Electrothrix sp.]|uniref:hypothetical protein n=1 Tax=Candidatus Electrothrix sp. TaxID=2170559 RepID=UPI004055AA6F
MERSYIDAVTQKELTAREEFIESLTHDSYVIQIPRLREKRRNDLEVLLSIFDQSQQTSDSRHFLNLDEADYPEEFQRVIRRLVKAGAEQDVCETMDLEDDILDELESLERTVIQREKALEEKNKALAEKDEALAENAKTLAENAKVLAEKDRALDRAVQALVASGMSEDDAKSSLGLSS